MTKEHRVPRPPSAAEAPLQVQNHVEPLHPRALLETALSLIEPDGTVIVAKGTSRERHGVGFKSENAEQLNDWAWANAAYSIAEVLYRWLRTSNETESASYNVARFLNAYRSDPKLLQAALALMGAEQGDTFHPPQSSLHSDWKSQILAFRHDIK